MWITSKFQSLLGVGLLALSSSQRVSAATGGSWCTNVMCVGATISEGNTIYSLNTTTSFSRLGWMAVGWGTRMTGSSIVILWPNDDGTITVSQRQAVGQFQPNVDSNPARVATLQTSLSTLTGSAITLSFSMPSSGQTTENMIYAMSLRKPGSSDPAASIQQHNFQGIFQLDLTQTVADLPSPSGSSSATGTGTGSPTSAALPLPTATSGSSNDQTLNIPYTLTEKKFIAHAVLSALGFCFFLPIGVLQARFLRIWWPGWFKAHWIVQAGLAGPCIVVGFALAVSGVNEAGGMHFADKHMAIGLALFVLYAVQAAYGLIIHLVKDPNRKKRPIQNYGHAIVGLALISLSLYQVWLGFAHEWSRATGRDKPGRGLPIFWIIWVVILAGAYIAGLALLPKQYRSEAQSVHNRDKSNEMSESKEDVYPLAERR